MQDERWSVFTREQIVEKDNSWDLRLIRDDSVLDYNDQPDPVDSGEEAVDLLMSVVKELRALEVRDRWREKRKPNVFRALGGSISTRLGAAIQSTSEKPISKLRTGKKDANYSTVDGKYLFYMCYRANLLSRIFI